MGVEGVHRSRGVKIIRIQCSEFKVQSLRFGVWGLGFGIEGFEVWG